MTEFSQIKAQVKRRLKSKENPEAIIYDLLNILKSKMQLDYPKTQRKYFSPPARSHFDSDTKNQFFEGNQLQMVSENLKSDQSSTHQRGSKPPLKNIQEAFQRYHAYCQSFKNKIQTLIITHCQQFSKQFQMEYQHNPLQQFWNAFSKKRQKCKKISELVEVINTDLKSQNLKKVMKELQEWQLNLKYEVQEKQRICLGKLLTQMI